ncbi:MAG: ubiquinone biosynthesis hydroxylase [Proteobacteria bacterium]|nr:ubiquinone biosynthesis hydroxylase [Pseudomonadota bacterium]
MSATKASTTGVAASRTCDLLIAGGGFAGLALAIALRQGLGAGFDVVVADPGFSRPAGGDIRASAIAAAARRLLEATGVWPRVAEGAQPILDMVVTDSRLPDAVRPVFLNFGGDVAPGEPFAHMVENQGLTQALLAQARENGVVLAATAVVDFNLGGARLTARCADATSFAARLLVGADGARSRLREMAGIESFGWDYGQSAIVTIVGHERDHLGRAEEHFLPAGPFATLPLMGRRSAIVWTEETREAERIMALAQDAFAVELERRFGRQLGDLSVDGPRRVHGLGFSVARHFVADRLALVGDAAHMIHPIAGQGLNMGLRDIAALAEAIADAARLGLDCGGADVLDRYQRWRRFDTMAMGVATDSLNRLFSNRSDVLRLVRDIGLGVVDRLPGLKQLFMREAAGLTGAAPKLLRGEAL